MVYSYYFTQKISRVSQCKFSLIHAFSLIGLSFVLNFYHCEPTFKQFNKNMKRWPNFISYLFLDQLYYYYYFSSFVLSKGGE